MDIPSYQKALCWIRRDIRSYDHRSLSLATEHAKEVACVFIFDRQILDPLEDRDDRRVTFIHRSLEDLDQHLAQFGSGLMVREGDPVEEIPKLAEEWGAEAVFTAEDYEPYALQRDERVQKALEADSRTLHTCKDAVILARDEVMKDDGTPYRVFTPYKRSWLQTLRPEDIAEAKIHPGSLQNETTSKLSQAPSLEDLGFYPGHLWLAPGESGASERLEGFREHIGRYHEARNVPSDEFGTSGLSVHLRHGTISPRHCVRLAHELQRDIEAGEGAKTWLNELIWRDFYHMILFQFPHVTQHAFRQEYDAIRWPGSDAHFEAWVAGQTGFPLVDAAMRHFAQTGWMHNRLRMVVASFFDEGPAGGLEKGRGLLCSHAA